MKIVSLMLSILICGIAQAQSQFYMKANNWFDGSEFHINETVFIKVSKGVIDSISTSIPSKKEKLIDIKDDVLIPGLIDGHTHVLFEDATNGKDFQKALIANLHMNRKKRKKEGEKVLQAYLESGFTTLIDLGNSGEFIDLELRNRKPRVMVSGPGISVEKAQFSKESSLSDVSKEYLIIDFSKNINEQLRIYKEKKVDFIKVYADNDPGLGIMSVEQLKIIKKWCDENNFQLHVHSEESPSIKRALDAKADYIHHVYDLDEEILNRLDSSTSILVPTYSGWALKDYISETREINGPFLNQKKLLKSGHAAFGSDAYFKISQMDRGQQALESLISLTKWGLSTSEILKLATSNWNVKFMKRPIGVIQKFAVADFIVVDHEILKSIEGLRKIKMVFFKGKKAHEKH